MRYLILFTVVFVTLCSCQQNDDYHVDEYIVTSSIRTRFACTKVYSQITNTRDESKELCFTIELSEDAYISNLCMEVDGVKYRGIVEEKERARDEYNRALTSKITVALVEAVEGVSQLFTVCTGVRARSSASFTVEYKQFLNLLQGSVEHRIPVENADLVRITATYDEPQGIRLIRSPNSIGYTRISSSGTGSFSYTRYRSNGISEKEITVKYEPVIRNSVTIYTANFRFIQLFSPSSDNCLNKNIVFVVDVSGSMRGDTEIGSVKRFLSNAIYSLNPENYFNIILFNSRVTKFRESLVTVDSSLIDAINFIENIVATGLTNMNDPLVTAAQHLYTAFQTDRNRANLLYLISDGHANSGLVTNADDINTNFRNALGNVPIVMNTYSVGSNANNGLLLKLTDCNTEYLHYISDETVNDFGLSEELIKTYEDYKCPLLSNVNFNYPDGSVDQLTRTSFPYFFKGQELAVSGRILSADDYFRMNITGVVGSGRTLTWRRIISQRITSQIEGDCLIDKMSAYMGVKQKYAKYLCNPTEELKNEIIEQSKQNHFVSSLTSLLVSEQIGHTCTCPDECICNTQCPISGVQQPANNVAGNDINLPTNTGTVTSYIATTLTNFNTSGPRDMFWGHYNHYKRRRATNLQRYLTLLKDKDCSTQVLDDFTVWQNMSQCRGSDNSVNNRIIQVRCRTDKIDTCRDYWIRSVDCDTGEVKYLSSGETGVKEDNRCIIWYDTGDNSLRCSTQHNMLQNLVELEVSFCPISDEENRDHQEEMELLYDEFDSVCDYSDELADCKLA